MVASSPFLSQTTCGSLLVELQRIWDEIGETDEERDKMLLDLERECLEVYRKKVESTRKVKTDLKQMLHESEAEIHALTSALGEQTSFWQAKGTLKVQISAMKPVLEDLRLKKEQRLKVFSQTQSQIIAISAEISGNEHLINNDAKSQVDETDLTTKRLAELESHLEVLKKEKALRLRNVSNHINAIHELSAVMSMDFNEVVNEVHPSLAGHASGQPKSICNDTISKLGSKVDYLQQEKQRRLQKVQRLGNTLIELWNLLETPADDQRGFEGIIRLLSSSAEEVSVDGCLSLEVIEHTEMEIERLNALKSSKMKELVLKRQTELEEICRENYMEIGDDGAGENLINLIDSGMADMCALLSHMDDRIRSVKELALSRREILDKLGKWRHACEEEVWLDEYEKDDNRYSAGRGAHKNLKRAEKARNVVGKIPVLVENLISKIKTWETFNGMTFFYDKTPLLSILEEYTQQRHQKEEEKRRSREQKRNQQASGEKEASSASRLISKRSMSQNNGNNPTLGTPIARRLTTSPGPGRLGFSSVKERRDGARAIVTPVNYVAMAKDDSTSHGN